VVEEGGRGEVGGVVEACVGWVGGVGSMSVVVGRGWWEYGGGVG